MITDYFSIKELVSKTVYDKYGDDAWRFFDPRILEVLLYIRETLDKPITINNWKSGGRFSQRGLRENISPIVYKRTKLKKLYLSAHTLGMAFDLDVKGMSAESVRKWLKEHSTELPHRIRIENKVNWLHIDVSCKDSQVDDIYFFNA